VAESVLLLSGRSYKMNRASATPEQLCELAQGLHRLALECQAIRDLTTTMFGGEDERCSRAEELCNQLQRLRWALDRGDARDGIQAVQKEVRSGRYGNR
jgi:hypothetical protein